MYIPLLIMKTKKVIERLKILNGILCESSIDTFVSPCDREFIVGFKDALTRAIQMLEFMVNRNQIKNQNNARSNKSKQ